MAAVVFGLLPAWLASRSDVVTTLKQQTRGSTSGRGQRLARHGLIVAEVSLALALLAVAGVMIRGFDAMLQRSAGWDTRRVLIANIHLPEQSTYDTEDKRRLAIEKLERSLADIPGTEATGICTTPPLFGYSRGGPIQVEGQTSDDPIHQPNAGYIMVGPGFFATLGIPLKRGPPLPAPTCARTARRWSWSASRWPGSSGRTRAPSASGSAIARSDKVVWREVIGVVRDIAYPLSFSNPDTMLQIYKPLVHEPWGYLNLLVRGATPGDLQERGQARGHQTSIPTWPSRRCTPSPKPPTASSTTSSWSTTPSAPSPSSGSSSRPSASTASSPTSSPSARPSSASASPSAPSPPTCCGLVLGTGVKLTLVGLLAGAGLAYALIRMLGSEMPRMAGADPATLTLVVLVLSAAALFASYWPARRATKVDPLVALRAE